MAGPAPQAPRAGAARGRVPLAAIVLPLAVVLGVLLRLWPCLRAPDFEFVADAAYHARLVHAVAAGGHAAAVDSLANAPLGRRTADCLPVGLDAALGAAQRVLAAAGSRDERWNLALLLALLGGLVALPVWWAVRAAGGDARAAAAAALASVALPAHLERTHGFALRGDGLGTLLATTHVALVLAALAAPAHARRWVLALLAGLALAATLAVWHVPAVLVTLEAIFLAAGLLARAADGSSRVTWLGVALAATLGMLPVAYLQHARFLLSPAWVAFVGLALVAWLPPLAAGGPRHWRVVAVLAAGVAALLASFAPPLADAALPGVLAARLGLPHARDPMLGLVLALGEFEGAGVLALLAGPREFLVLGGWLVLAPALAWLVAGRPAPSRLVAQAGAGPLLVAWLAGALFAATLVFQRYAVLLAPLLAVALGVFAAALARATPVAAPVRRDAARARGPRPAAGGSTPFAPWLTLALALSALATMGAGVLESRAASPRLDADLAAAIGWIRQHARPGETVACDWDAGFDVQARAALATPVDGVLESAENRARIRALYGAWISPSPSPLLALCARWRARWLLVPTGDAVYAVAAMNDDPLAEAIARGDALTEGPLTDHVLVHLVEGDREYPGLRRAYVAGGYRVYEVVGR